VMLLVKVIYFNCSLIFSISHMSHKNLILNEKLVTNYRFVYTGGDFKFKPDVNFVPDKSLKIKLIKRLQN
jgi:hypothetical protein